MENAAWPVFLAGPDGEVLAANAYAKRIFSATFGGEGATLNAVWAAENGGTPADFLRRWEQVPAPVSLLKFRVAGIVAVFNAAICSTVVDGRKCHVLQLLPASTAVVPPEAGDKAGVSGDPALKQKLDCVLQLARTVSLDFNNALTGVLAHTSLLLTKTGSDQAIYRSLLEIEKSAARAAEIAAELAQFSRQEKETRRVPAGNLNLVVSRCVEFARNAHGARFVWRQTLERSLFAARFDEAKLQQALTKILENAAESFGVNAGGQIVVLTRNVELTESTQDRNVRLNAGTYICVEVSDNGIGIEAETLPRIFDPFFTTKRPPHRGLGLALVYGIITNHGGGVAVSSQPGVGTSARVYLPAEKSFITEAAGSSDELRGTGTVLVVDDESLVLTMADTILSDFGYKVLTANSGPKALSLLGQAGVKVDLVITDLVMPGMGGRELAERIREMDPALPVMPTSGYMMAEDKTGAANYLQKPFTSTELLRKVKAVLAAVK